MNNERQKVRYMKNKIEFSGYKYSTESIKAYWNGLLISDYLMEKFNIRIALSQCDYKKAKDRVLKAVRYVLKEDKIQQVGLLMENNEAYTFRGCNYIVGKSTIKDRFRLYKQLLENAKKDNYEFATTQRAELGSNFTIQNVKSNLVKITKKLVKCN